MAGFYAQHVLLQEHCALSTLPEDCLMTACQLSEDWLPTDCRLPANCLPIACQLTKDWLPIWFMAGFYAPHVLLQEHCASSTSETFDQGLPDDCQPTAWRLPANCLQTACQLLASWLKTDCQYGLWLAFTHRMFYCKNTVRPQLLRLLIKDCLTTASQLPEDCLPTACHLPADCLPTACQLTKDWLPIWFMAVFYA